MRCGLSIEHPCVCKSFEHRVASLIVFTRTKALLALCAALAAGVLAAVALGQEVVPTGITATVKVMPDKAGTPSRPRGVVIDVRGTIEAPGEFAPPMPSSVDVWFPKGWLYNGAKYPTCALATMARTGITRCPAGSIMSHGARGHATVVDAATPPEVTIINGGRTKMYFWVVVTNPARVARAVTGTLTKLNSPRWSYRLHADIPPSLQVVAGIPLALKSFHSNFGQDDWIATTSCPRDHHWRYRAEIGYTSGQVVNTAGVVACRS